MRTLTDLAAMIAARLVLLLIASVLLVALRGCW